METFKPKVFITGITGGLGNSLHLQAKSKNIPVYGHSTKKSSDTILNMNFADLDFSNFENFFKENDINCLINNAAVYSNTEFINLSDREISDMININLTAPIILTKYFYSNLVKQNKFGILINVNSLAGKYPNYQESIYCASKYGLAGFGSSLSINQKVSNIRVVDCYVGAMKTNITKEREGFENFMDTDEVANFIFNLLLDTNKYNISSFEIRNIK